MAHVVFDKGKKFSRWILVIDQWLGRLGKKHDPVMRANTSGWKSKYKKPDHS